MKSPIKLLAATACTFLLTACGHQTKDWRTSDSVRIAVDETFRTIMDDEFNTFKMLHPGAVLQPNYCSEDSAIRLLLMDSVRSIIATRELTDNEKQIVQSHRLGVKQARVATDAFALIVNKANTDTLITVDDIRGIVSGRITRWEQLRHATRHGQLKFVFDNSGSSTVRYMRDSLLAGQQVSGNLYAQGSNEAVIQAVKSDPEIIGVVGANWLKANTDTVIQNFDALDYKVLKVARTNDDDEVGWRPYQARIASGDYPLLRAVYAICTDPRRDSFTTSFFFFLKGQKGQTIILNDSQLLPYSGVQYKFVTAK